MAATDRSCPEQPFTGRVGIAYTRFRPSLLEEARSRTVGAEAQASQSAGFQMIAKLSSSS